MLHQAVVPAGGTNEATSLAPNYLVCRPAENTPRQSPRTGAGRVTGGFRSFSQANTNASRGVPFVSYFPPVGRPSEESGGAGFLLKTDGRVLPPQQPSPSSRGGSFPRHREIDNGASAGSRKGLGTQGTFPYSTTVEYQGRRLARETEEPSQGIGPTTDGVYGGAGDLSSGSGLSCTDLAPTDRGSLSGVREESEVSFSSSANSRVLGFTCGNSTNGNTLSGDTRGPWTSLKTGNTNLLVSPGHIMNSAACFPNQFFSSSGEAAPPPPPGVVENFGSKGTNNDSFFPANGVKDGNGFLQSDLSWHPLSFPYSGETKPSPMTGAQVYPDRTVELPKYNPFEQPFGRQPLDAAPWSSFTYVPAGQETRGRQAAVYTAGQKEVSMYGNSQASPDQSRLANGENSDTSIHGYYTSPSGCGAGVPRPRGNNTAAAVNANTPDYQGLPTNVYNQAVTLSWDPTHNGEMRNLQPDGNRPFPLSSEGATAAGSGPSGRDAEYETGQIHQLMKNVHENEPVSLQHHNVNGSNSGSAFAFCGGGDCPPHAQTQGGFQGSSSFSGTSTPCEEGVPSTPNRGGDEAVSAWGSSSTSITKDKSRQKCENDSRREGKQNTREDNGWAGGAPGGLCVAKVYFHKNKAAWRTEALIGRSKRQKSFSCKVYGEARARELSEWAKQFALLSGRLPTDAEIPVGNASEMTIPVVDFPPQSSSASSYEEYGNTPSNSSRCRKASHFSEVSGTSSSRSSSFSKSLSSGKVSRSRSPQTTENACPVTSGTPTTSTAPFQDTTPVLPGDSREEDERSVKLRSFAPSTLPPDPFQGVLLPGHHHDHYSHFQQTAPSTSLSLNSPSASQLYPGFSHSENYQGDMQVQRHQNSSYSQMNDLVGSSTPSPLEPGVWYAPPSSSQSQFPPVCFSAPPYSELRQGPSHISEIHGNHTPFRRQEQATDVPVFSPQLAAAVTATAQANSNNNNNGLHHERCRPEHENAAPAAAVTRFQGGSPDMTYTESGSGHEERHRVNGMQTVWLGENRQWRGTTDMERGRAVDLANGWTGHVYGTGPVKGENKQWDDRKPSYTEGQFKGGDATGEKKEKVQRICAVDEGKVREGGAKEEKQFVSDAYPHFSQGDDIWSSKELLYQQSTEQEDSSTTQEGTRLGSGGDIVLNNSFRTSKSGLPGGELQTGLSYCQQGVRKEMIDKQTSHEHSSLAGPPSSCFPHSPLKPPGSSIATPSTTCPGVPSLSSSPPLFSSAILPPAFESASFLPGYHTSPQISLISAGCFYPQSEGGLPRVGGIPASNSPMYYLPLEAHSVTSDDGSVFPSHCTGGENVYTAPQTSLATEDCPGASVLSSGASVLLARENPSVSALSGPRESSEGEKRSGGPSSRTSYNAKSSSSSARLRSIGNSTPSVISSLCETKTHTPLQSTQQKKRTDSTEKRKRVRRSRTKAVNAEASSSVQSWGLPPGGTSTSFSLSPSSSFSSNAPPLPSVSGFADAASPPGLMGASSFLSTSQSTMLQGAHVAACAVSASFSQRKPFEEVLAQAHRCLDREESNTTEVRSETVPGCKLLQQTDNSLSQLRDPFGGLPLSSPDGRIVVLLHPVESRHPLLQPKTDGAAVSGVSPQVSTWGEGSLYGDISRDCLPAQYGVQHEEGVVSQALSVLPSPCVDERKDFFSDGFPPSHLSRQTEVSGQEEAAHHHAATSNIPTSESLLPHYYLSMGDSQNADHRGADGGEDPTVCEPQKRDKDPEPKQESHRDQYIESYAIPSASGEQGTLPLYFYNSAQQQQPAYNVYAMSPCSVDMVKDSHHDTNTQIVWNTNGSCLSGERSVSGFSQPPQGISANEGTAQREEKVWTGPYSQYHHATPDQSMWWSRQKGSDECQDRKEAGGGQEVQNVSTPGTCAFFPPPQHQAFGSEETCKERQKDQWQTACNDVVTAGHVQQGPVSGVVSELESGRPHPVSCEGGSASSFSSLPTLSEGEGGECAQGYEGGRNTTWRKGGGLNKKKNSRKYGVFHHQDDSTDASLSRGQEGFEGLPKAPPLDVSVSPSFLLSDNDEVSCPPLSSSNQNGALFLHPTARDLLGEQGGQGEIFHAYGVTPDMNCPLPVCFSLPQQLCNTVMNGPSASQTDAQEREFLSGHSASKGEGGESAATPGETRRGSGIASSWGSDGLPQESFGRECKEEDEEYEEGRAKKGDHSEGGEGLLSSGEAEWIRERTTYFQEDDEETTFSELEGLGLLTRPKGGRLKRFNVGKKPYSGVRGIYFQQGAWKVRYRGNAEEVVKLFPYTHGVSRDLRSMSKQFKLARQFLRQVIAKGRQLHDSDGEGLSEDEPAWLNKRRAAASTSSSMGRGLESTTSSRLRRHYCHQESFPYMSRHSRGVRGTLDSLSSPVLRECSGSPHDSSSSFHAGRYSRRLTRRTHFLSSPPSDTSSRPLTPKDYYAPAPPSRIASAGGEEEDDWGSEGDFASCGDGQNLSHSQSNGLFGLKWVSSRHESRRKGSKGKRSATTSHRRHYGGPYFGENTGVMHVSSSSSHVKGGRKFAGDAFGREGRSCRGFHDGGKGIGIQEVYVHPSMERMMMTKPISGATFFKPVFFPPLFGPESEPWGLRADRILEEVNSLEEKRNAIIINAMHEHPPAGRHEGGQEDIHMKSRGHIGRGEGTEGNRTGTDVKEDEDASKSYSVGGENVTRQNGREDEKQTTEGQGKDEEKKEEKSCVKSLLVDHKREEDKVMKYMMAMPPLHIQKANAEINNQSSAFCSSSSSSTTSVACLGSPYSSSSSICASPAGVCGTRPVEESSSLPLDMKRDERKRPAERSEGDEGEISLTEKGGEMKRRKIDVQNGQGIREDGVTILTQNGFSPDMRAREVEGEDIKKVPSSFHHRGETEGQEVDGTMMGEERPFMTQEPSHALRLDTPNRQEQLSFSERLHPSICIAGSSFPSTTTITPSFATSSSFSTLLPVESSSRPPSFPFEEHPSSRLSSSQTYSMCAAPPPRYERHRSTAAERRGARRDQFGRFLPGGGSSSPARRTASPKRSTGTPGGGLPQPLSPSSSNSCSSLSMALNSSSSNTSLPSHARVSLSHRHSSLLLSQAHHPIDPERQSAYRLVSSYPWDFLFDSRVPGRFRERTGEGGGAEHGVVPPRNHPSSLFYPQQG
ncbi:ap2 domain transcription factor ap2x-5 [Cystoisospora suis]|uniref:Ap2 domain transcription factor ap2x-5 n=1 Tax=Cystoisospora suis TaxID=483139 RepID=A0A2C6LC61_9APIC|nr:ap2 domain transcription factor ap2x-5 [Cystoisospora suis]